MNLDDALIDRLKLRQSARGIINDIARLKDDAEKTTKAATELSQRLTALLDDVKKLLIEEPNDEGKQHEPIEAHGSEAPGALQGTWPTCVPKQGLTAPQERFDSQSGRR